MDATQSLESYGTSWLRDLLRAYTFADNRLQTGQMKFNGFTDANHGKTPFAHGTHDLGMAMDLGFVWPGYVNLRNSQNQNETATTALNNVPLPDAAFGGSAWSKQNAIDLLTATDAQGNNLVRNIPLNNQVSALKDFLDLYSLTQRDRATSAAANAAGQVADTGDWEALRLVNEATGSTTIRTALFGNGTSNSGLIQSVIVGSLKNGRTVSNQNPLYDMRTVLTRSGVSNVSAAEGHHNHFHIYLRPPQAVRLQHLDAATDVAPSTSSSTEQESSMLLDFLNPAASQEIAPAAYVQLAQADANPRVQMTLEVCGGVETQNPPGVEYFAPSGAIRLYWNNHPKQKIGSGDLTQAKVTVLEQPKYGVLKDLHEIDRDMGPGYSYDVIEGTPNGTEDRAVFLVEIGGKRIKVVERFILTFNYESLKACNGKGFYIRRISQVVNETPVSPYELLQLGMAQGIDYRLESLPGLALAQTTGSGSSAQITLDTDAAGYGWYLDPQR